MRFLPLLASLFLLILPSPLDSTPFHSHDGNLIQSKSQSQSSPALHGNASIESRPDPASSSLVRALPVVSESNENSDKPAKEEGNQSLDKLKKQIDDADTMVNHWKDAVNNINNTVNEELKKRDEANGKVEHAKSEYARLKGESDRIGKAWTESVANAKETLRNFTKLQDALTRANKTHQNALSNLSQKKKEHETAQKNLNDLNDVGGRIANITKAIEEMVDGKPELERLVLRLKNTVVPEAEGVMDRKQYAKDQLERQLKRDKCDRQPLGNPACANAEQRTAALAQEFEEAKEAFEQATRDFNGNDTLLDTFDSRKIDLEIKRRDIIVPSQLEIEIAEKKVKDAKGIVDNWTKDEERFRGLMEKAEENLENARTAKVAAEGIANAPIPAEVKNAKEKAGAADNDVTTAENELKQIDEQIGKDREKLSEARRSMFKLEREAAALHEKYDAAMMKNQGLSAGATGGIIGGILVIVVALSVGFGVCYWRKIYVFKPKNNDKDAHDGASTNSIGRKQAIAAKAIAARALEPEVDPYIFMTQPTPRPDRQPIPYKLSRPKDKKDKSPKPEEDESSAPPLVIEDTQPDNSGPAPGNPPAPAPAKAPSARDFSIEGAEHVGVLLVPPGPPSTVEAPKLKVKEAVITKNSQTGNDMMKI